MRNEKQIASLENRIKTLCELGYENNQEQIEQLKDRISYLQKVTEEIRDGLTFIHDKSNPTHIVRITLSGVRIATIEAGMISFPNNSELNIQFIHTISDWIKSQK